MTLQHTDNSNKRTVISHSSYNPNKTIYKDGGIFLFSKNNINFVIMYFPCPFHVHAYILYMYLHIHIPIYIYECVCVCACVCACVYDCM